jgi:hypothetical protein
MKKHKPWFNEGYSQLSDERKQDKLQWIQGPSEINRDNVNAVDCESAYISGIKRGNILKTELMSLQRTVRTRTSETCMEE